MLEALSEFSIDPVEYLYNSVLGRLGVADTVVHPEAPAREIRYTAGVVSVMFGIMRHVAVGLLSENGINAAFVDIAIPDKWERNGDVFVPRNITGVSKMLAAQNSGYFRLINHPEDFEVESSRSLVEQMTYDREVEASYRTALMTGHSVAGFSLCFERFGIRLRP